MLTSTTVLQRCNLGLTLAAPGAHAATRANQSQRDSVPAKIGKLILSTSKIKHKIPVLHNSASGTCISSSTNLTLPTASTTLYAHQL